MYLLSEENLRKLGENILTISTWLWNWHSIIRWLWIYIHTLVLHKFISSAAEFIWNTCTHVHTQADTANTFHFAAPAAAHAFESKDYLRTTHTLAHHANIFPNLLKTLCAVGVQCHHMHTHTHVRGGILVTKHNNKPPTTKKNKHIKYAYSTYRTNAHVRAQSEIVSDFMH